jgi:hypothetical protein
MSWTKKQVISQAFVELGLADYVFNLSPEQWNTALLQLDSMMATWNGKGIRIRYPIEPVPQDMQLDSDSGLPDYAVEAGYLNLALRIAPSFGKQPSQETKVAAKDAYNAVLTIAVRPLALVKGQQLAGAGNRRFASPLYVFLPPPPVVVDAGGDGPLEYN